MLQLQPFQHLIRYKNPIDAIGKRCGVPHMLSQIVYALANKRAFLFTDEDSFCVLRPQAEAEEKIIEVWVAYSRRGNAIRTHLPQVKALAREVDAGCIQFWTVLPVLDQFARRLGFERHHTEYDFTIWRIPL
ncbi:hypothetical protein ACL7TT_01465 [Microbulbifer sp. 2304DJ12-6]|uniref:hypothetical protein n=1 Tax=Microbulbifer sp. 2304DJ12-6 TaxID=3233340 RepID=UPI0039B07CDE